ncbi:MAG: UrcA family protein [Steroidobacteraceae bacterium]
MKNNTSKFRLALVATGFGIVGVAVAQELKEIVVETPRVERAKEHGALGAPIDIISVTHRVTYKDIEINTRLGAQVLETRVKDAAKAACKEIDALYPLTAPSSDCERTAVDKAMVQVHEAIAAAEKKK